MQATARLSTQRSEVDFTQPRTSLSCHICPHNCDIKEGSAGKCRVIINDGGRVVNTHAGYCSHLAVEPIEKRPLFHFMPGNRFLSVGFFGCNFTCSFCQNFTVSQNSREGKKAKFYSPKELISLALERETAGIVFTYNEPTVYHEYIQEVGHEIQKFHYPLKLVLKTNGFASPFVIRDLCLYVDAFNVDIKGDNEDYQRTCGAWIDPTLDSIECIVRMQVHLEISYLVLPSKLHDVYFNIELRDWLASLNRNIPLHLLYFYPFYEMSNEERYQPKELVRLWNLFHSRLNNVYISNRFDEDLSRYRQTFCSICNDLLVDRSPGSAFHNSICCRKQLSGVFQ